MATTTMLMSAPTTTYVERVNSSSLIKNGSVVHKDSSIRRTVGECYQYTGNGSSSTSYQQPPVLPLVTHNHPKNEMRRRYQQILPPSSSSNLPSCSPQPPPRTYQPQLIVTISAGFDKGDYLIREERGANVYFDFLEEAYNYA